MFNQYYNNISIKNVLQYISANNLVICNEGTTPTFVGNLGHSIVDLTLTNVLGQHLVQFWKVDTSQSLSDHQILSYSLSLGNSPSFATCSSSKCDWSLYQKLVKSAFEQLLFWFQPVATGVVLNKRQNFVNSILLYCLNQAFPVTRSSFISSTTWWTADLTTASQSTKALRRKANRTKIIRTGNIMFRLIVILKN